MRRSASATTGMALIVALVWVGGPASSSQPAAPTQPVAAEWQEQQGDVSPGRLAASAMAYDSERRRTILFGGNANGQASNDTWQWNGRTWNELSPADRPRAVYEASMAYDPQRDEVVLFGGFLQSGLTSDDTWVFDGVNWTQRSPAVSPSGRAGVELVYDEARAEIVLFGGDAEGSTWTWDGSTWEERSPAESPTGRTGHEMAYDQSRQAVILYGGYRVGRIGDTWSWDGTTWTELQPDNSPRKAWRTGMSSFGKHVVLFGGMDRQGRVTDSTWVLQENTWRKLSVTTRPSQRSGAQMAYDSARREVVLFGGSGTTDGDDEQLDDTWTLHL